MRARAAALRGERVFAETAGCLLYGEPGLEAALDGLGPRRVYLVPLFMAEGITLGALQARVDALAESGRVAVCRPVGSHPRLAALVARAAEAEAVRRGWPAGDTAVVLVGHGSRRSDASRRATEGLAEDVAAGGRFAEVAVALLENGADLDGVLARLGAPQAIVIGCFAEPGRHALEDVPALLARARRPVAYRGPIGAEPWFDRLILDQALDRAARDPCLEEA